ncbi:MAG: hypothetical protein CSYNP_03033 [Syntrophus sp. SKADARSKE-3]|nr:hypothetical protein [Syntrophus sp. SKADARSKE-3]
MRKIKIILICLVTLLALIGVAGFFIVPPIAKSILTDKLSQALKRPVSIQSITINPYALSATIRGFEIAEPAGKEKFISFDELYVNLDSLSIFKRALILKEIRLAGPYARIIRNPDATYNFSDLLIKPAEKKEDKKADSFHFSLNNIHIEKGSADFWDGPKKTKHTVRDLKIAIPFISNMDYLIHQYTQPVLSATINGDPYLLQGRTKPFEDSLESYFDIDIKDIDIPYYLAYVPMDLNFKLLSGKVDTKLQIIFTEFKKKKPSLNIHGAVALRDLSIDDKKDHPLLRAPSVNVELAAIEPFTPLYHVGKVTITSPEINIHRDKKGDLNLMALIPPDKQKDKQKKGKALKPEKKPEGKSSTQAPLPLQVDELLIDGAKITFRDEKPNDQVSLGLDQLHLKVNDFSMKKDAKSRLELATEFGKRGQISAMGPFTVDPLSAELALKLDSIDLRTLQGYFNDKVKITLTNGAMTAAGNMTLKDLKGKGLTATYNGKCLIANFSSIDKQNGDDFLKWKSLYFSDMHVGYNPLSVNIRQIALADFYAGIIIDDDGVLNLQNIVAEDKPAAKAAPAAAQEKSPVSEKSDSMPAKGATPAKSPENLIKIGAITLQGGTIDFTDRSVDPDYSANLSQIGGRVSGLSSIDEKPAEVELRGKYNNSMPAEITGKISPLRKDLLVDLKASFKGMDLSSASPYSGKYIGYNIQKGQLSFDLKYLIVNRKLESENKIFVDQLTLGNRVESPQATTLPVGLAIALLKDRKGEINLDVPVTGSLDDPQFSIFRLVLQVLGNLITKAVTAPFALLGSLVGGGEELGYLEFDYGRSVVSDTNLKKIQTLAKALNDRPALKLDIEGHVDPVNDREGLKKVQIERKMKARKLNDMVSRNLPTLPAEDINIPASEYEKYLTQVYRAESFPKPRNAIGMIKALPVAEMEKLLMTHAIVKDDDLRLLAIQRAQMVKDLFLKTGQITPDRIFLIESKTLAPEKKEKLKDSRVDFKLK